MAYKTFVNGFVLNASELNDYLMDQSVIVFASAASRASTLTSPTNGMVTYLADTGSIEVYGRGNDWISLNIATINNQAGTTYTTLSSDAGKTLRTTSGSAVTVTLSNLLPGERVDWVQSGAGQITFVAGAGVNLQSEGSKLKSKAQHAAGTVLCVATNTYLLTGNLTA